MKRQIKKGYSPDELKKILSSRNWNEGEVEEAMGKLNARDSKGSLKGISSYTTKNKKIILYIIIPAVILLGIVILVLRLGIFSGGQTGVSPSSTSSQAAASQNLKDCGKSISCLELSSQSCAPSEAMISSSTTVLGVTKSKTILYEIRGIKNGKCVFYIEVKKDGISFSSDIPQSTIDSEKASFNNQQGESGTCFFNTKDLSDMLTRWEHGDTSSGDFKVAACGGSYFN